MQGKEREMKKTMKKLLPLLLAVVMSLAFAGAALAATVTVNPPEDTQDTSQNQYKIYKIFDAVFNAEDSTKVSYTLPSGITIPPAGFKVENGNVVYDGTEGATDLTTEDIAAIQSYISDNSIEAFDTKTVSGTNPAEFGDLAPGYYYITTTTGTAVAIQTNNTTLIIDDKNEAPEVTKVISATDKGSYDDAGKKALAEVGSNVTYTATVTKKNGAENYVFHDSMDNTLSYNNDVKVYTDATCETQVAAENYSVSATGDDTLTITFDNTYMAGLDNNTTLYIKYSAKVTSSALQDNPAKNTASLSYGHTPGSNSTPVVQTETYNASITVNKLDASDSSNKTPLAGAKFKLKNSGNKFYAGVDEETGAIIWNDEGIEVEAVAVPDPTDETQTVSYTASFAGLQNGTYTLIESTVPAGYNKAADQQITISGSDNNAFTSDSNLKKTANVDNKKGGVLPSTGGIGTTIFYIAGSALVLVAGAALFARRVARKQS